ncbi:MAG: hypothetical protein JO171_13070, partial [Paludibacterium sp.]|nr:hypothetical protein [Paludibacterium sp.]
MKSALVIAFVAAAIFAAPASAKEILKVCAKQYNGEGNHNAYFVESTFLSGSELNIATHSMS